MVSLAVVTANVNYVSDGEIGGFQFNVVGATINSASGGAAGDASFMLSNSADLVLGFSLSGATIPSGEGLLVVLDLAGTPEGIVAPDNEKPSAVVALDDTINPASPAAPPEALLIVAPSTLN